MGNNKSCRGKWNFKLNRLAPWLQALGYLILLYTVWLIGSIPEFDLNFYLENPWQGSIILNSIFILLVIFYYFTVPTRTSMRLLPVTVSQNQLPSLKSLPKLSSL